jgi:uncharacterized membrane protein YedE/YeeE
MAFTPISAAVGGALIGASASAMLLLNGRITGISGILGGAIARGDREGGWRVAFLVGLVVGGVLLALTYPASLSQAGSHVPLGVVATAGLLVGVGTQIGSGCTSGHGVCGISRLSMRSTVATLVFMATGAVSAFVVQHFIARASS